MNYKSILVCISDADEAERLVPYASLLARQFDAHLTGLHALQSVETYASISMQVSGAAMTELQDIQTKRAKAVKEVFYRIVSNEDFVSEWRQIETSMAATGERLAEQTRCADLVIMGQIDPEHSQPGPAAIQRHIIEHSGRPVLVVPRYGNFSHMGKRVLIGWSGTGECSRAVHDAIQFCQQNQETNIFWVSGQDTTADAKLEQSGHDIARALSKHDINATVSHQPRSDLPIGDVLLNKAADSGADLIVTGAYGHSRLYDFVIGATTSHLLKYMTVPVLFSN